MSSELGDIKEHWRLFSALRDIISTLREYYDVCGGYHECIEGCSMDL